MRIVAIHSRCILNSPAYDTQRDCDQCIAGTEGWPAGPPNAGRHKGHWIASHRLIAVGGVRKDRLPLDADVVRQSTLSSRSVIRSSDQVMTS